MSSSVACTHINHGESQAKDAKMQKWGEHNRHHDNLPILSAKISIQIELMQLHAYLDI